MKTLFTILFCSFFTISNLTAAPTSEEAVKDWKNINAAYDSVSGIVDSYNSPCIYNDFENNLVAIQEVEKDKLPKIKSLLDSFGKKYGTTAGAIDNNMRNLIKDAKAQNPDLRSSGYLYETLKKFADNITAIRENTGKQILKEAESTLDKMSFFTESIRAKKYAEVKKQLELALKYDPNSKEIKEKLDGIDKEAKAAQEQIEKGRDEAKWPEPFKNFAGPGNQKKLAAIALEYFKNDEGWGARKENPEHCIAVAIRGNWGSSKKNILGQTIQWYLPVYLAIYRDKDKDKSIARVFELSMLTKEEANVEKEPPFVGITVGDNWVMRRKNLPGGGGSGGCSASGSGFFGTIFWLALVFGNILAGLIAAAPLLKQKVPQLNALYEKITPVANIIGVTILAVGVLSLLGAVLQLFLLRFVILSNILPQVSAIAVGLFLGKELLMKKPNLEKISKVSDSDVAKKAEEVAENATLKAQELLTKYDDKIALLEKYQVKIGLACIIIGVLHLFLSSWPLI